MKTDGNDNAFQEGALGRTNTLTKREYFAAVALQGILSSNYGCQLDKDVVINAVRQADLLIEELNKNEKI